MGGAPTPPAEPMVVEDYKRPNTITVSDLHIRLETAIRERDEALARATSAKAAYVALSDKIRAAIAAIASTEARAKELEGQLAAEWLRAVGQLQLAMNQRRFEAAVAAMQALRTYDGGSQLSSVDAASAAITDADALLAALD